MYKKSEQITIRVNPILKDKFMVAIGFLDVSAVLSQFMQDYYRKFEIDNDYKIPIRTSKQAAYDIITNLHGIKITEDQYNELEALYPKTRKNKAIYGSF